MPRAGGVPLRSSRFRRDRVEEGQKSPPFDASHRATSSGSPVDGTVFPMR